MAIPTQGDDVLWPGAAAGPPALRRVGGCFPSDVLQKIIMKMHFNKHSYFTYVTFVVSNDLPSSSILVSLSFPPSLHPHPLSVFHLKSC